MDNIVLKTLEDGRLIQVVTETAVSEIEISRDDIVKRINDYSDMIKSLQSKLEAIDNFNKNTEVTQTVELVPVVENPIINEESLNIITNENEQA